LTLSGARAFPGPERRISGGQSCGAFAGSPSVSAPAGGADRGQNGTLFMIAARNGRDLSVSGLDHGLRPQLATIARHGEDDAAGGSLGAEFPPGRAPRHRFFSIRLLHLPSIGL
jgi:hypothetical protein